MPIDCHTEKRRRIQFFYISLGILKRYCNNAQASNDVKKNPSNFHGTILEGEQIITI